jgi:hypothetical protein
MMFSVFQTTYRPTSTSDIEAVRSGQCAPEGFLLGSFDPLCALVSLRRLLFEIANLTTNYCLAILISITAYQ